MKHIVFIVGARPNFMKLAPIYDAIKSLDKFNLSIIHTGQHHDPLMSDIFIEQLMIPLDMMYSLDIEKGTSTQTKQIGDIMIKLDDYFRNNKTDLVMVFGDVTSTLAGGLAAHKMCIPLCHIESGNRSYDKSMPEEINRIIVDSISDYHFVSEPNGINNLKKEGIINNVFYVGNPMIDTLLKFEQIASIKHQYNLYNLEPRNYILLTIHRPFNVDDPIQFDKIIDNIKLLTTKYKIIYPVHHRKRGKFIERLKDNENIVMIDPLGYIEFVSLMMYSAIVITDSGGLQEETTALKIPCITLRPNTERPITINHGTNHLLTNIDYPNDLYKLVNEEFNRDYKHLERISLWDGKSGKRIAEHIGDILSSSKVV